MGEGIGTEETVTNFKITLDPGSVSEDDPTDDASLSRYHPIDLFFFLSLLLFSSLKISVWGIYEGRNYFTSGVWPFCINIGCFLYYMC